MLLGNDITLEDYIVMELCKAPGLTAKELKKLSDSRYRDVSIQAIYQTLNKLAQNGVISKIKERYTLRLAWIADILTLIDKAYEIYSSSKAIELNFSTKVAKQKWRFSSLAKLMPFHSQLVLMLCQNAEDKVVYDWTPHVWYHFASKQDEIQVLRSLKIIGIKYFLIVGNNTDLDLSYRDFFKVVDGEISFGVEGFTGKSNNSYLVVGDYISTVKINKKLKEKIDYIYKHSRSQEIPNIADIVSTITDRSSIWLQLEYNPQKSQKLRRKFQRFFGDC